MIQLKGFYAENIDGDIMKEIVIGQNEAGQRLDRFLMKYLDKSSRNNIYKLIRKKVFRINGKRANAEMMIHNGDVLSIYLQDESLNALISTDVERKKDKNTFKKKVHLDIVYEDDDMLIVNKPKGLLTHPNKSEYKNTLSSQVAIYLEEYATRMFKPAPVHRLDKNTSGLVIFAKTYQSLKKLNADIRDRQIQKKYICVVEGYINKASSMEAWLKKNEDKNKSSWLTDYEMGAKQSIMEYRPIKKYKEGYTLVEVDLHTGRSHQIRVMLSGINHPIVGDVKYGAKYNSSIRGQLLCAYQLIIDNKSYMTSSVEINDFVKNMTEEI